MGKLLLVLAVVLVFPLAARAAHVTVDGAVIPYSVPEGYVPAGDETYQSALASLREKKTDVDVHALFLTEEADAAYRADAAAGLGKHFTIASEPDVYEKGYAAVRFNALAEAARRHPECFLNGRGETVVENLESFRAEKMPAARRLILPVEITESRITLTYWLPPDPEVSGDAASVRITTVVLAKNRLLLINQFAPVTSPDTIATAREDAPAVIDGLNLPQEGPEEEADALPPLTDGDFELGDRFVISDLPEGYVIADSPIYELLFHAERGELFDAGVMVHAAYVPEAVDELVQKDPRAHLKKYLLVATEMENADETVTPEDFAELQADARKNPDSLMRGSAPGTHAAPRRVGPVSTDESAIYLGFMTKRYGEDVAGVLAYAHTGTRVVLLYLYQFEPDGHTLDALRAEMPRIVADMDFLDFANKEERNRQPLVLAGIGLILLSLLLGAVFLVRDGR